MPPEQWTPPNVRPEDFNPPVLHFGTITVTRGTPPSKGGSPTLTFQMPVELARGWPTWASHVEVIVDNEGVHLLPRHDEKPRPETPLPFDTKAARP